ncbi:MAG: NAD(P)/FAD-dependent oxidoreductase [Streptosporangiaceae bacterium]
MDNSALTDRPRVLVLGAGFAGYHCLRRLERRLPAGTAEVIAVSPADYMLYVPLLPEVTAGVLGPHRVAVPLRTHLRRSRLVLGTVTSLDLDERACSVADIEGRRRVVPYDRLVITCGSVTRLLAVPGVAEHAMGFKSVAEALYLRDHILQQLELAEQCDDDDERAARLTFVVVGAGYTGTEVAAQGALLTQRALRHRPQLRGQVRWVLVDLASRVLPGLDAGLSGPAANVLHRRGVDIRLGQTVSEVTGDRVVMSDGTKLPSHTVVWCVGVRPDPLISSLGLPTNHGRLVVDERLAVPGHPEIFAAGDIAAVPDLTRPGAITAMTAQHAQRQGKLAAENVAASLGHGRARAYKHHDLGFVVDLGGWQAVANPLGVPLSGPAAKAITRGYHLLALPGGRLRVATDWIDGTLARPPMVQFGLVPESRLSS